MSNFNPTTGIRYGVIACDSLDPDLVQELMYGPNAVDVSYQEAYEQATKEAGERFDNEQAEAELSATETDGNMSSWERERHIEAYLNHHIDCSDRAEYIDSALEWFSDTYLSEESTFTGEHEGVKYRISWLGGAPILWVLEGYLGGVRSLCSPCVPDAGDLNSGFAVGINFGHECYVVPRDWLAEDEVQEAA